MKTAKATRSAYTKTRKSPKSDSYCIAYAIESPALEGDTELTAFYFVEEQEWILVDTTHGGYKELESARTLDQAIKQANIF